MNVLFNNETGFVHKEDDTVANERKQVGEMGAGVHNVRPEKLWSQSKAKSQFIPFCVLTKVQKGKRGYYCVTAPAINRPINCGL